MQYRERLANSRVRFQEGVGERWVTMTLNVVLPGNYLGAVLERCDRA
jgi:hypothetical protein